ncbi:sterol 3-beta-glucosyltransferase UGT80A2-like [Elaeis guineensis]|uniref:sterol 3-beta-glucosyltransferase UGT80A2-like n=1 Tax=Elaeis guineensis var. tenera TaxID=51953 RepID=UPI003C6CE03A
MAESSSDIEASNGNGSSLSPSATSERNLPRANTMPGGTTNTENSETSSGQPNLGRSQTERHRQSNLREDPTAQLFDDKISVKKKLKMLNRIATVRDDGTVVVEVPSNLEPASLNLRSEDVAG